MVAGAVAGAAAGLVAGELGVWSLTGGATAPWTLGLTVAGAACGVLGWELGLMVLDALVLAFYFIVATTPAMVGPEERWIRSDQLPARPLDAVVVLSGRVTGDTTIDPEAADRLLAGLELMKRGVAPLLVTTRDYNSVERDGLSSDVDQKRLIELAGLDTARWLIVDSVRNTHDEAVRSRAALAARGGQVIAVVTSPMHTRRACATFEAVGFTVYCEPARPRSYAARNPLGSFDWIGLFQEYLYERLGMVKYRVKGWVKHG